MGSTADVIASALGARTSTGMRGTHLTFQRGDHWYTLTVRDRPHLELSLPVPGLVGLELHVQLGETTVRGGDARTADRHWRLRSNDVARALRLFDEAPWPEGKRPPRKVATPKNVAVTTGIILLTVVSPFAGMAVMGALATREAMRRKPEAQYVLTVEREVATLERHASESEPELLIGMAERLVQLATRPARLEAEIASSSSRNHEENGPYR